MYVQLSLDLYQAGNISVKRGLNIQKFNLLINKLIPQIKICAYKFGLRVCSIFLLMSLAMAEENPYLLRQFCCTTQTSLKNQVDVSLTLAKHLLLNNGKDSNVVFSPISIQVILGMLAAGSNDQTLDQLLFFLKAKSVDQLNYIYSHIVHLIFANGSLPGAPCLSIANFVWLEQTLFIWSHLSNRFWILYKACCQQVDFLHKVSVYSLSTYFFWCCILAYVYE